MPILTAMGEYTELGRQPHTMSTCSVVNRDRQLSIQVVNK